MDLYYIREKLRQGIPITKIPLRVTIYARVSTDHKEQQNSLSNQISYFNDMINNNPDWTYINNYIDNGITGTSDIKRNKFMEMIKDAKQNKFDLIITKEISRFSRNTLDSIKYTRELLDSGVAVYFINDNINTALPDSELRLTIMASMAQDEIRRLSERVKFGMNESIRKGNILGHNHLYGYKQNKKKNKLDIVDNEAKIVRRIFKLYVIDNISLNKITDILNNENIKTNNNNKWCVSTISRMIKNPKYKGYYCGKKSEVINYITKEIKKIPEKDWYIYKDNVKIPPIVEENIWNKAQDKLNKTKKINYHNRYPLSSKIYCLNDNHLYHRRIQCQNDITWLCSKYLKEGKQKCHTANIRESEIYIILDDIIKNINLNNITKLLNKLYKKDLTDIINNELTKKYIKDKIIELLINKILVTETNNTIIMYIYLNNKINLKNKTYIFKRKNKHIRYQIKYTISC